MKTRTIGTRIFLAVGIVVVSLLFLSFTTEAKTKYCSKPNCYRTCASGSNYCYTHKSSSSSYGKSYSNNNSKNSSKNSSTSKKKSYYDSYDDGYEAVYGDGDYDWDRYQKDWNYASGVDDALDDWDEYGEDW